MAASLSSVQSILSLPAATRVGQKSRCDMIVSSMRLPRQQKSGGMQVRCMAREKLPEQPTPQVPPPSPKAKKVSGFREVMAFSGPAPERINGRLAMVGFVTAIAVELAKGDDVVDQLANGGLPWFVYVSVLFSLASLVPLLSGVSVESKSKGFMTSNAELWNGRFAMLGLVGLVLTEFVKGGALV